MPEQSFFDWFMKQALVQGLGMVAAIVIVGLVLWLLIELAFLVRSLMHAAREEAPKAIRKHGETMDTLRETSVAILAAVESQTASHAASDTNHKRTHTAIRHVAEGLKHVAPEASKHFDQAQEGLS